jgi:hypothetical protein
MFQTPQRSTGTRYSIFAALLLVAFAVIPLLAVATRPLGQLPFSIALIGVIFCTALAWFERRKYSDLTLISVVPATVHARLV